MINNNGLGRGLSSLIPQKVKKNNVRQKENEIAVDDFSEDEKNKIIKVNPEIIKVNPMQPRQNFVDTHLNELVESIKEYGIIQPLIVTESNGNYELIAGERRLRASKKIGLKQVPVIVRDADEQEKLGIALVENLQREDLNPIETATAFKKLIDEFNLTQDDIAKKMGRARTSVGNTLRMLKLPNEIQRSMMDCRISEGHAKYLLGLESEEKQMFLYKKILRNNLTVRETGIETQILGGTKRAKIKINYEDKDKEFIFREFFGARVNVKRGRNGGQVIISFYNDEELDEMVRKIKAS